MGITAGVGTRHERKLRTTTPKLFYGRTINTTADTISIHCLPEKVKQSRRGTRARDGQPDDQGDGRAQEACDRSTDGTQGDREHGADRGARRTVTALFALFIAATLVRCSISAPLHGVGDLSRGAGSAGDLRSP